MEAAKKRGIKVGYQWYPVVAMRWARGETLGKFVDKNVHNPQALRTLCLTLSDTLARLEAAGWRPERQHPVNGGRLATPPGLAGIAGATLP